MRGRRLLLVDADYNSETREKEKKRFDKKSHVVVDEKQFGLLLTEILYPSDFMDEG